jgi:sugar phosphate isomerase/epimerase
MINRRTFVKTILAGVAASMVFPGKLFASSPEKLIGIQLYTLHGQMKEDPVANMQKVAKIGYNAIETAGYADRKFYGIDPVEFKVLCDDLGLIPQSSHADVNLKNIDETIDDTINAGMTYLVLPSLAKDKRKTLDDYRKAADEFNTIGEKCKEIGLTFAYHNHAFEFEPLEDTIPYDILLENTDPELVTMELDIYWIVYGGADPLDYFKRYPGRFQLFHVKDMSREPGMQSTEIGEGTIDYKSIFAEKAQAGMKYFYLEQESFEMDPFASIAISYDYLKNLTE